MAFSKMREAVRDYELGMQPSDDIDFEFLSPNQFTGPNIGLIPVQNGVQPTRLFYGARFANQAQPLVKPEAPWVQTLVDGEKDTSFDDKLGTVAGALRANEDLEIDDVLGNIVHAHNAAGEKRKLSLYKYMPFNRYSGLQQTPVVQKGQVVPKGGLLARSNFTDDKGSLALGLNARVGLVAYKGHSMDDAIVVSSDFAKRATSHHIDTLDKDFSTGDLKAGKGHFLSLFPEKYTRDQLGRLDDLGVVQPGQIVQPGDPLILATRPRSFNSSQSASFGRLGKVARTLRSDSSLTWDQQDPGQVMDVVTNKNGTVKVVVESMRPMRKGDKVALRSGQKGIVSKILQPEEMPRTADGQPLEVLLNHQGIPSRANPSLVWEVLLGKIAAKTGKPLKLPAFNNNDESWLDYVEGLLKQNGIADKEVVFDPAENRKLEKPITVGNAYILKLHHLAEKKVSGRGQASYDCFDAETEVFTARGWIKWPEVTLKDKLLDPQTLADGTLGGDFVTPTKLQSYHFEGEMLRWDSKFLNWVVTPNHKFHVRLERTGPVRERTAAQLYARDGKATLPCAATWTGGANPALKIVAGVAPPKPQSSRQWPFSEDLQVDFADYADFAAWYIAEGSFQVSLGLGRYRVFIWQNEIANPQECQAIKALLTRLGLAWYPVRRKGLIIGYAFQDARWALLVQTWGAYAWTKHIPEDILMASPEVRRLFLETYLKGDGSETACKKTDGRKKLNRISSVASTSPHVIRSLEFLITSLGMTYGVQNYPSGVMTCPASAKMYDRRAYSVLGIHLVRKVASMVSKKCDARYEGAWQKVPYCGRVYCATMPSGKLLVRREGKMCITGNSNEQPSRGSGEGAQSKRRSGLEIIGMLSSGAVHNLREGSTLSGQRNDDFWKSLRAGQSPKPPGTPFVFHKFRALLNGAGLHARDMGDGKLRLGLMTDRELDRYSPLPVKHGRTINFRTLQPESGGLFDPSVVAGQKWGFIDLPEPMPNPAAEETLRALLNLSKARLEAVLTGEEDL